MNIPFVLDQGLLYAIGFFWAVAYVLIIRRALLDRAHGMPMAAMCANTSWELIFSVLYPHKFPLQEIYFAWWLLDLGILYTYVRFGRKEFPKDVSPRLFIPTLMVTYGVCFCMILLITFTLDDFDGRFTSFPQCFMMSILFIRMLKRRDSIAGQSVYIAVFKCAGTFCASLISLIYWPETWALYGLYAGIFAFDAVYFVMLYRRIRKEGLNPWKRL